jgi:tetratricopeptide (TPR) repeat protein
LGPRKYSGALWSNASNIIIDLGEFKKALNYYEQSIQLSPDFMQMYKGYQADLASEHLFL